MSSIIHVHIHVYNSKPICSLVIPELLQLGAPLHGFIKKINSYIDHRFIGYFAITIIYFQSIFTDEEELSPRELKRVRMREKKQFMKYVKQMEDFLVLSRSRLAGLFIQFDKKRDYLLPLETVQDILGRLRVPVEDHVINVVCDALENHTGMSAVIDYRLLLKRGLVDILEQYLTILEQQEESNEFFPVDDEETKCLIKIEPISTPSSTSTITQEVLHPTKSTMDGKHGEWSEMFKEDAQKQFMCLIEYCQRHNIILDKASAERGNCLNILLTLLKM